MAKPLRAAKFVTERARHQGRDVWLTLDADTLAIEPHVMEYALHLTGNGSAENTIKAYIGRVTRFLNWAHQVGVDWKTISLAQLARFKWSVQGEAASPRTVDGIPTAVIGFLRYQGIAGTISPEIADRTVEQRRLRYMPASFDSGENRRWLTGRSRLLRVKLAEHPPQTLSAEQVEQTIQRCCGTARDRFLLRLLYSTGIRIGEALGLRREDIHFLPDSTHLGCQIAGAHLHVRRRLNTNRASAKTRMPRAIPVTSELVQAYVDYMHERLALPEAEQSDFVLVNLYSTNCGAPMTYSNVRQWMESLSKQMGFRIRPHMLRHTAASRWLHEGGATVDTVQTLLGHVSAASTSVYLHPEAAHMRAAVEAVAKSIEERL